MNSSFPQQRLHRLPRLVWIGLLSLCLMLGSCSTLSNDTDVAVNSELEQQVLQIIRDNPEVILESVQAYQQNQQDGLKQQRQSFLNQIKENPQAIIADSPTQGATDGQIVLFEFSDFQCPFCSRAHATVKQFMDRHLDQVTLVYKHLPLTKIHPEALPAARAAWAAQQQGKFWEYQESLFEQQKQLGDTLYLELAEDLNLDLEQFNRDRNSDEALEAIQADVQLATGLGASGTPFFVMNGETFSGAVELSKMESVLAEVKKAIQG
ncbi:MAG: DsbA family protein [Microcoleaceae cyanobacterium]